jgi:hypothetical protein
MLNSTANKIDTNLYSRQIGAFGLETMGKLIQLKVLLIGLRGAGIEVSSLHNQLRYILGRQECNTCRPKVCHSSR